MKRRGVPLCVVRGFSSKTFLYQNAQITSFRHKPARMYHFGDLDPSGIKIPETGEDGLRRYALMLRFISSALQLRKHRYALKLPTRPTKRDGNMHAKAAQRKRRK